MDKNTYFDKIGFLGNFSMIRIYLEKSIKLYYFFDEES